MGHKLHSMKRSAAITLAVAILAALGAVVAVKVPEAHAAAQHATDNTCPVQFAAPIYTCDIMPVGVKTNKSSNSSSSSHIKIVVHSSFTANVREYEIMKNVRVGFSVMPGGLPKAKQGECRWGDFAWSQWRDAGGGLFYAPNGHHGRTHACWDGHNWRQIGGGPGQWNCGNIVVPVGQKPPKHAIVVPKVVGFRSHGDFNSVFEKWVKTNKSSTSTSTHDVEYYCRTAGFNPGVVNGREVCYHVVQIPGPTPTTTPTGPIVCSNIGNNNGGNCNTNTTTTVVTTTPPPTTTSSNPTCTLNLAENKGNQTAHASVSTNVSPSVVQFTWGDGAQDQGSFTSASHTYATPAPAPAGTYTTYTISARAVINGNWVDCGHRDFKVAAPPTNPTGGSSDGPPALPGG